MKISTLSTIISSCLLIVLSSKADETVWLSTLDLSKASQGWGKPQADRSVDDHQLTLRGQTYARGFGTHSPGLLVIDLKGGTASFTATVGVDDEVPVGKGSAEFEVLGPDKRVLWRSGVLRQGDEPKVVSVNLTGLSQIALRVTTGGDGFEFDHADWAGAKFAVSGAAPQATVWPSRELAIDLSAAAAKPEIHPPFVIGVRPGTPLVWAVPVSGTRPLRFSADALPAGISLDPRTGAFSGRLERAGDYAIRVRVENEAGRDERGLHIIAGDRLALTPPMGWNSYDCFGDNVVESEVLANARYVAAKMQPYGWDTIVVDYRWYDPGAHDNNANARKGAKLTMDQFGRLLPSPNRFPSASDGSGFQKLADQVHGLGLRFGIHIMRGIPRNAVQANTPIEKSEFRAKDAADTNDACPWCPDMFGVRGDTAAGQAYYDSLFRLYASWGVDYVKMDDTSSPYHASEIEAVAKAIAKSSRSIILSLSPGETPINSAEHVERNANLWRVSGDFWDNWGALNHEFILGQRWEAHVGPGHWPDADMLPLGHLSVKGRSVGPDRQTHFTRNEQVSLLSLWALLPSPLMVGGNMPDNDSWTLALLTNPEVLAVNQDSLGEAGKPVVQEEGLAIWAKKLADGSMAVGLLNRDDFDHSIAVNWSQLGLSGERRLRDLWLRKDMGAFENVYQTSVPAHGAVLVRVMPAD